MSDISSSLDSSFSSDDSEYNFIPGFLAIEAEIESKPEENEGTLESKDQVGPYLNEPLADEEWTRDYNKRQEEKKERDKMLHRRLESVEATEKW